MYNLLAYFVFSTFQRHRSWRELVKPLLLPGFFIFMFFALGSNWVGWNVFLGLIFFAFCVVSSVRASTVAHQLSAGNDFLRSLQHEITSSSDVRSVRDNTAALHLYLTFLDRDFGENDYEILSALDETNCTKSVSPALLNGLPTALYDFSRHSSSESEYTKSCCLCLEIYNAGDKIKYLVSCPHFYHAECIDRWLVIKPKCPICKSDVFPS
ncbi:uncharacterized protein LOC126319867 [Schistocerca gregaria]|uniref:uncharacterized protein LOC126319867 n=1 Tax=Schistocerca gregaria TaxID=7010 RepID=UPI00211E8FE4|nr:uncharacterized protein LOC126319867 [Schistocerca gregaria]